ncbi:MAG: DUF2752 domain-containing protein [Rhodoferax sp.]|nr:DUF2752 domain-containing protein [Actinomycetota bacterium]
MRASARAPLAVLAAAGAALAYVGAVDPERPGHYPGCPFLLVTGWFCPGCGSLRALHALAHGDLTTAVARNPLAVCAVGVLPWVWLQWLRHGRSSRSTPTVVPASVVWGVVAAVSLFGVLRNLPALTVLAP